ncbi:MAG: L,D-transpeptidase [Anaerolineales bacterium]|nr:L,D-transpeptidase [Anaerolineales bacterium]
MSRFSRRDFLKLTGLSLGTLALVPIDERLAMLSEIGSMHLPDFPSSERLARNCVGGIIPIKTRPDMASTTVREIYEDTVLAWLREVPAENPDYNHFNQRWVETPEGYVFASDAQLCYNRPNEPLTAIPEGKTGFWVEVTVPYVDCTLDAEPAAPLFKNLDANGLPIRLYFSQIMWIDRIHMDTGVPIYRAVERYGSYGDALWAEGAAFRPITEEEVAPIHPEVDSAEKTVVVNLNRQSLSCLEQGREVYFCRVSTGVGDNATPLGDFATWRKTVSIHMAGGTVAAGYDTPGIGWTTLFQGNGVAIHSTFWHNKYGERRSHGCVNCQPDDAKWVFLWTAPHVPLEPGDITWGDWQYGSSHVIVEQQF